MLLVDVLLVDVVGCVSDLMLLVDVGWWLLSGGRKEGRKEEERIQH